MKICMLNGNLSSRNGLDRYLKELGAALEAKKHSVVQVALKDLTIKYCTGCFGCWLQTPGEYVVKDDSAIVCRELVRSDLALFASPVIMGFPSALLKKTNDKLIPLIHPYLVIDHGEVHHRPRYDHYPQLGLILQRQKDTDDEDMDIITRIYERTALNLKSSLAFVLSTKKPVEEVVNEINSI